MPIPSDTIALPIVKGLDITTDARLVNPPSLLEAENTQFAGGGAKKRRGHTSLLVRNEEIVQDSTDAAWVFGLGTTLTGLRASGEEDVSYWRSPLPTVGQLHGVFTRDNETLAWDGSRLFSYTPSQLASQNQASSEVEGEAVFPSLNAKGIAKFNEHQGRAEFADSGTMKVAAWVTEDSLVKYAVYDSVTDALVSRGTLAVTTAAYLRAFTLGAWMHIAVLDSGDGRVKLFSINSTEPSSVTVRSYGDATHFDLYKVSDSEAVLARTTPTTIYSSWISTVGSGSPTRSQVEYTPSGVPSLVSVSVGLVNMISLAYYDTSQAKIGLALFDANAVLVSATLIPLVLAVERITQAPHFTTTANADPIFEVFADDGSHTYAWRYWTTAGSIATGAQRSRYNTTLASRAFTVGDRVFYWGSYNSALQSTWLLMDEGMKPIGHMDFGVADTTQVTGRLAGVNFNSQYVFNLGLNYKLRVAPKNSALATSGIYTESSIKAVSLNFLPSLSTAQAGRATYIAGAQLWSYDGQEVTEAGFHIGPEPDLVQGAGGNLTALGTYSYRVDLCYRNAQNEEVRSLSILTDSLVLIEGNKTITLNIPTLPTRRDNAYFLIFRNAMSSGTPLTTWWLLNSRDPADTSYLPNDLTTATVTYVDDGSVDDTAIQTRELHPATDTYLQPVAAPACEVITSGRDRLWVAGGELLPGVVAPSRLFDPGEIPSFNAYLNIQVDRSVQAITALGFVGEVAVIFREGSTHLLDSDGPDNVASGLWNPPRLALSDTGAVSQASIARISNGLLFQSLGGIRLLGAGGGLQEIGSDIDSAIIDFDVVGTLVSEKDQEVRFYGEDSAYVLNYEYGTWARWSCGGAGVAKGPTGAILAREDGYLWIETPGVWTDGGATYSQRIRTSWLRGGNLGDFQRVRLIGGLGRYADLDDPAHTLRLEIYYDEREFWEERVEWSLPDSSTNQDTWGSATWGSGVWGDTTATIENLEDLTWEWARKPSRQKCSVFSVALQDVNTDGPGFELSAFTFELARKPGLDRTPERSGTGTYRS